MCWLESDPPCKRFSCYKAYRGASELRQMRLSSGSPLLAAVLAALPEPLSLWIPGDVGADDQGIYELIITSDRCPCADGCSPSG